MKIGLSQMSKRSPLLLGRLRNCIGLFKAITITYMTNVSFINRPHFVADFSLTVDYALGIVVIACIFTGRADEESEKSVTAQATKTDSSKKI